MRSKGSGFRVKVDAAPPNSSTPMPTSLEFSSLAIMTAATFTLSCGFEMASCPRDHRNSVVSFEFKVVNILPEEPLTIPATATITVPVQR